VATNTTIKIFTCPASGYELCLDERFGGMDLKNDSGDKVASGSTLSGNHGSGARDRRMRWPETCNAYFGSFSLVCPWRLCGACGEGDSGAAFLDIPRRRTARWGSLFRSPEMLTPPRGTPAGWPRWIPRSSPGTPVVPGSIHYEHLSFAIPLPAAIPWIAQKCVGSGVADPCSIWVGESGSRNTSETLQQALQL